MSKVTLDYAQIASKLKDMLIAIDSIDMSNLDFSSMDDASFKKFGAEQAAMISRLRKLKSEIDPRLSKLHDVMKIYNTAMQPKLFEEIEFVGNNDSLAVGFETKTTTTIDRAALDAATGLSINVSSNNPDLYTKACVRARTQKVIDAANNGLIPSNCVKTTTIKQGCFIFNDKDETKSLVTFPPKTQIENENK